MKVFINGLEPHMWAAHLVDWVERRDQKKYPKDCNYGQNLMKYGETGEYWKHMGSSLHLRAENVNTGNLHELWILSASRKSLNNEWPIVCFVINNGIEEIEEFNCDGESKSGNYKLHREAIYFDPGDYVVTTMGSIGIYANHWYQFVSIDKDGTEHLDMYGCGQAYRPATEDEIKVLEEMLWVNNKKWNKETLKLEDI